MKHHLALSSAVLAASLGLAPASAHAQEQCEVSSPVEAPRLLRRLSLDLRDRTPNMLELEAVRDSDDQKTSLRSSVERYLASPAFTDVMRTHHKELLWPNIDQVEFMPGTHILYPLPLASGPVYLSPLRAAFSRVVGGANLFLPCKDEPAQFDANGELITEPLMVGGQVVAQLEGWVEVEPFWAPGTTIRVCGLDAQANLTAPACPGPQVRYPFLEPTCQNIEGFASAIGVPFRNAEYSCDSRWASFTPGCGCGPGLQWCHTPETLRVTSDSLLEQQMRIVDKATAGGLPYSSMLTAADVDFNGPIAHYMRYQSHLAFDLDGEVDPTAAPPDIPYTDMNWTTVTRTGRHSGVLTTPAYLLRFASNRGRAFRFYGAFECSAFIPDGPLPPPSDPCSQHEDLTQRCGCNACHIKLEPMAAHWGRFSQGGFASLDEATFPADGTARCQGPYNSLDELLECFRHYELEPVGEEEPFAGMLNSYVFRNEAEHENIRQGPRKLVQDSLDSGRFNGCAVRRMWTQFMRRAPTLEEEQKVLPELIFAFEQSNYDLKTLVKVIVLHPAYGREL